MRPSSLSLLTALFTLTPLTTAQTGQGCYALGNTLADQGAYQYQSSGYCLGQCRSLGQAVYATGDGNRCYCGNMLPSGGSVDASNCNTPCVGYPDETCGSANYLSVFLTGVGTLQGSSGNSGSSAAAGGNTAGGRTTAQTAKTSPTPVQQVITTAIVQQGVTVIQTVTARASASASGSAGRSGQESGNNGGGGGGGIGGGAIAGIVIGVLALLAMIGAGVFLWKRKQQRDASSLFSGQEYKRQIEPVSGGAAGAGMLARQGNGGGSFADTRLDTSLAMRRNSSESFADNQDYSRKILRVVN